MSIVVPALACSSTMQPRDADARVTLTTDRSTYAPADTVMVTLKNEGDQNIGFSLCEGTLDLRVSVSWEEVQHFPAPPAGCTMSLQILSPGQSARGIAVIPASAAAGHYRLTFFGTPPEARTTNEFAVASH
jgi:hypothetical protein